MPFRAACPPEPEGTVIEAQGTGYEVEFMLGEPDDPDWIVLAVLPEQVELACGAADSENALNGF